MEFDLSRCSWSGELNKKGQFVGNGTLTVNPSFKGQDENCGTATDTSESDELTCTFRRGLRNGKYDLISKSLLITVMKMDLYFRNLSKFVNAAN